jgi:hypothetical protein
VKFGASSLGTTARRAPWTTVGLDVEIDSGADPKAVLDALGDAVRATCPGGEARSRLDRVLAKLQSDAVIARDQIHYFAMLRSSSILGSPKGSLEDETARLAALTPADWDAASARVSLPFARGSPAPVSPPGTPAGRPRLRPVPSRPVPRRSPGRFRTGSGTRSGRTTTPTCSRCTSRSFPAP